MDAALDAGAGEAALRDAAAEARRRGITAVPAFVFGGSRVVVGAHPAAALVQAAEQAAHLADRPQTPERSESCPGLVND